MTYLSLQVQWLKDQGFGGWMTWCLDLDDFTGNFCNEGTYPLLRRMNTEIGNEVPTGPTTTTAQ